MSATDEQFDMEQFLQRRNELEARLRNLTTVTVSGDVAATLFLVTERFLEYVNYLDRYVISEKDVRAAHTMLVNCAERRSG